MSPLILGGGPAGSAAAIALSRHGIRATIIERDRDVADAICGGFLSWRTLDALRVLGIRPGGHPVRTLALFAQRRVARVDLPGPAMGLSRRSLDTMMRDAAAAHGAGIDCAAVREVAGSQVHLADGATIRNTAIFLATGKHDVRGLARPRADRDPALGLRIRIAPHPRLSALIGDAVELHLFERGYAGLVLQEDGSANLCLAVRKSRLGQTGGRPDRLLAEIGNGTPLGDRLAFADVMAPDAVAAIPYGWRATATTRGVFRLGDQAAVIASLAGEGIGIAVASAMSAADAFAQGGPEAAVPHQRAFARRARRPLWLANALWQAAEQPALAHGALPLVAAFPRLAHLAATLTRLGH